MAIAFLFIMHIILYEMLFWKERVIKEIELTKNEMQ